MLAAEPPSGTSEPRHHFVEDEQDAVAVADLTDGGEVAGGGTSTPLAPVTVSRISRGDGLRPLVLEDLLEVRAAGGYGAVFAWPAARSNASARCLSY